MFLNCDQKKWKFLKEENQRDAWEIWEAREEDRVDDDKL